VHLPIAPLPLATAPLFEIGCINAPVERGQQMPRSAPTTPLLPCLLARSILIGSDAHPALYAGWDAYRDGESHDLFLRLNRASWPIARESFLVRLVTLSLSRASWAWDNLTRIDSKRASSARIASSCGVRFFRDTSGSVLQCGHQIGAG
jgi:hypothetical protein